MKIMISYFYQIRFFTPNMIPLSTAKFDPIWYHQGSKDQSVQWLDKNGVWNGVRAEEFAPGPLCDSLCQGPEVCRTGEPQDCLFLRMYYNQLKHLNFEKTVERMKALGSWVQEILRFPEEPIIVLIVHEAPSNPCSERRIIQKWFADNGYNLEEFNK